MGEAGGRGGVAELRKWSMKNNWNPNSSEGLMLTLPRTVRHGFGSNSGCSSFTTPTQPYSYKSSSSLLLHRPSGCIWETKWKENFNTQAADLLDSYCTFLRLNSQKQPQHLKLNQGLGEGSYFMEAFSLLCKQWSPKVDTTGWDAGKAKHRNSHINANLNSYEIPPF